MPKGEDASGMLWCCHPHSRLSRLSRGVELQHLLQQHGELQSLSQSTQRMDLLSLGRWPAGLSSEKGAIYSQYEHESMRFETTTGSCGGTLFSGSKPMFSQGSQKTGGRFRNLFLVSWWLTPSFVHIVFHYIRPDMLVCWVMGTLILYDPFDDFLGSGWFHFHLLQVNCGIHGSTENFLKEDIEDPRNSRFPWWIPPISWGKPLGAVGWTGQVPAPICCGVNLPPPWMQHSLQRHGARCGSEVVGGSPRTAGWWFLEHDFLMG